MGTDAGPALGFDEACQSIPFLQALPAADRDRLRPYAGCRRIAKGERIWLEGDATADFTFVARGRAKLVQTSEGGREVIVEICGPGELLCASAVCSFAPYCCSALAMEEAVDVVTLPRRDLLGVLERSPGAAGAFLREVTGRGLNLCRRVEELSSGQVEQRIATLLLRLAEQVGELRDGDGTWIPVPLSRQDLADLVGTTVETAIRVMTRLSRQGIVHTARDGFSIPDLGRLDRTAQGGR